MTHTRTEMSDAHIGLFGPPEQTQKNFKSIACIRGCILISMKLLIKETVMKTANNLPKVRLWNQYVSHGKHSQSSQLLRGVKHHRRETTRHFGVQPNLDTGLDLILTLHQQVQKLLSVDHGFTEVCHQTNQSSVPLVHNLRRARLCKTMHKMGNTSLPWLF